MKAVLVGTGWRAAFYLRISNLLPSLLKIVSIYTSTKERADQFKAKGYNCSSVLDQALSSGHDAVIVSTGRDSFYSIMRELGERGEFILSETAFSSLSESERNSLMCLDGAVMEQYPYDPLYSALISVKERAGDIDQVMISGLHNHHSAALFKALAGNSDEMPEKILAMDYPSKIVRTGMRSSMVTTNEEEEYTRKIRILKFKSSLFIHDFSTNQYHSYLMPKRVEVRGSKAILTLESLRTTDENGYPVDIPFVIHRDSSMWNSNLTISHISLGNEIVYTNPFYPVPLNDDEIGIATIIKNIEEKKGYRTIKDGIEDAALGSLL